jgi:hypothetical protein
MRAFLLITMDYNIACFNMFNFCEAEDYIRVFLLLLNLFVYNRKWFLDADTCPDVMT